MAAFHWINPVNGLFTTGADWSGGVVPGAADDAILDAAGAAYIVTSNVAETINGLQTLANATLSIVTSNFTINNGSDGGTDAGLITIGAGASLTLNGLMNDVPGGTIQATNGGVVTLANASRVSGGSLISAGTGVINAHGVTQYLSNVTLTSGSLIDVNNDNLDLNTTFTNNGTLRVLNQGSIINETGTLTVNGSGTIALDDSANFARIYSGSIVFGAGQTVRGSGQIGINQTVITNNGLISGDVANRNLDIDPSGGNGGVGGGLGAGGAAAFLNAGTIQANGASTSLTLETGQYDNTAGVIQAINGGVITLANDVRILNGLLTSVGAGVINAHGVTQYLNNVTLTSGSVIDVNNDDLYLNTSFVNNGTIQLSNIGSLRNESGALTITGTGTIVLNNSQNVARIFGGQITFGSGQTILGSGQLGINQTIITNNNLFSVSGGGGLDIDPTGGSGGVGVGNGVGTNTSSALLNNGIIQATGASTVSLETGLYENAPTAVIRAIAGSTINLNNDSRILNGSLSADATSIINAHGVTQYLNNVTLTSGSLIDVNNDNLYLNTVFTNNGTIKLSNIGSIIDETGSLAINGTGTIILDNSQNVARIFGGVITFGAGQTVQGAGQLGINQTIFVINNVFSANAGTTLDIDVTGGSGGLNGAGVGTNNNAGLLNNSTIQATGGSILSFETGLYENAANGVIQALDGSTVNLNNDVRILNGLLTSVGAGVINAHGVTQYLNNVTLTSGSVIDVNNDDLYLNTSFVNNGTIQLSNIGSLRNESGALTITGTGTIVLNNSQNVARIFGGQITFGSGQTILGSGQLGINQTIITNNNLFSVSGGGGLDIDPTGGSGGVGVGNGVGTNTSSALLNNGIIQATGASTVSLETGLYENAPTAVIRAIAGSTINLNNDSRILNGSLSADATSIINAHGVTQYLNNVTLTSGSLIDVNNDNLYLNTVFTNNGTIKLSNIGSIIDETGSLAINGTGTIILDNSQNVARIFGGVITFGAGQTVQGAGQLGINQTIFVINNVFSANAGTTLDIDVTGGSGGLNGAGVGTNNNAGLLNNSTIQATGGSILSFETGLYENAANGVIQALDGSTVNLNNDVRILNGLLTSVGAGVINAHGVTQYLNNVTLTSGSVIDVNNDDLYLNTSFVNNGTIQLSNIGSLRNESGALTITGTGTIVLNNSQNVARIFGGQITFGSGQTILGSGQLGINQTIITNNNLFSVSGGGGLDIDPTGGSGGVGVGNGVGTNTSSALLNNGIIQATGASTVSLETGLYENAPTAVIRAIAGSTINLNNDSRILNGSLSADATSIINAHGVTQYLNNVTLTSGSLIDVNNDNLYLNTVFTNNGTIKLSNIGSIIDETGSLAINGTGTIILDNSQNVARIFGGVITFGSGQTILGSGQLGINQTVVTNSGLVSATVANGSIDIDPSGGNGGVNGGLGAGGLAAFLNLGTIQANGAKTTINLFTGQYDNTSGVIQAINGGVVNLTNDVRIIGGALTSDPTSLITANGATEYLNNVTLTTGSNLAVTNNSLYGNTTLTNNGTITLANQGFLYAETPTLTINGTGAIVLDNSANVAVLGHGAAIVLGAGETVRGSGSIGYNNTLVTNTGLISADVTGGSINIDPAGGGGGVGGGLGAGGAASFLNLGTIQANGSNTTVNLQTGQYDNTSGVIQAINGGVVNLTNDTDFIGGAFSTAGGGLLQVTDRGSTLDGRGAAVTNTGTFTIPNNDYLTIEGTVANSGVIALNSSGADTRLVIGGTGATVTGSGMVSLTDNGSNSIQGTGGAVTFTNVGNTITGAGQIGGNGLTLANQAAGVIDATGTHVLNIDTGASAITNAGLIETTGAGGATIQSAIVNTGVLEADGGPLIVNGAVSGGGSALIAAGTLDFTSTFNEAARFTGVTGILELAHSQTYGGVISGFATHGGAGSDALDLADIAFVNVHEGTFSGSATGGTLTVSDGTHTAAIALTGANYTLSTFLASSDGHGGTLIMLNDMIPLTSPESYSGNTGHPIVVSAAAGVLANDIDPNGLALTAALAAGGAPAHGNLTLNADGSFIYTPNAGYFGADSFSYVASDSTFSAAPTTVTLNIAALPPASAADTYGAQAGHTLAVAPNAGVLANDSDPNGLPLTAALASGPLHGAVTLNSDGSFIYTPTIGFAGADTFSYTAVDPAGSGAVTPVTINVVAAQPTSAADGYSVHAGQTITVGAAGGVLANDSDPNGLALSASLAAGGGPSHGVLTLNPDGSFAYTPNLGFAGQDAFTYVAGDSLSAGAPTVATITVSATAPSSGADSYSGRAGQPVVVMAANGVLANDSDPNGLGLTANLAPGGAAAHGTVALNPDGSFTYTPNFGFAGQDVFTYVASDAVSTGAPTAVVVNIGANPPATTPDIYSDAAGQPLRVAAASGVLANDSDPNGLPLSASLAAGPTHGAVTLSADGSFVYAPTAAFVGQDAFSYVASDGVAASTPTTVLINIIAGGAPVTQPDNYSAVANQTLTISAAAGVLANDAVAGGGALTAAIAPGGQPIYGTVHLNADGSFNYTLNVGFGGFIGTDSFSYVASNGVLSSLPTVVSVAVNNGAAGGANMAPQIQQAYNTYFGRDPHVSEYAVWQGLIAGGDSLRALRGALVSSPEGQTHTTAEIQQLYETYFGRDPTASEYGVWQSLIAGGVDFNGLRSTLLASSDGQAHTNSEIQSLYGTYFGRDPQVSEYAVWQGLIAGGGDFNGLRATLVGSPDGQSHTAAEIKSLYDTYFGRDPSTSEYSVWQGLVAGGTDFNGLRATLVGSAEGASHTTAEIRLLYDTYFGRDPSGSEYGVWQGLIAGGTDFNGLRATLVGSSEGQAHTTTEIKLLYDTYFGRDPSGSEYNVWQGLIAGGTDFNGLRTTLVGSPEGQGHTTTEIKLLYDTYFGRDPSGSEYSVWQGLIAGGTDFHQLQDTLERQSTAPSVQHVIASRAQTFVFGAAPNLTIDTFNPQLDTVTLSSAQYGGINPLDAAHAQQISAYDGTDVLITLDASHSILLEHIQLSALHASDFLFG